MSSLSYAIIGTGAIGGYYGARLQQAGCEVHFLLRGDYEAVRHSGIAIESIDGDFELPQVKAYSQSTDIPPVDVAIVALKTTQNNHLHTLLPPIKKGGAILSLQNGLGIEADISRQLKGQLKEREGTVPDILGGLCFICSNRIGPGHFRHSAYGRILLGAHNPTAQPCTPTPLMGAIAADFAKGPIAIETTDDLPMARWQKLVWNVPYSGLSVVLDATTEEMMADSGVQSLITTLMAEVINTANAWGEQTSPGTNRHLPFSLIDEMIAHTEVIEPYRTSMKIDYDENRPLEVETIVGNPLRAAQAMGVSVPTMTMLYQQLSFLNNR